MRCNVCGYTNPDRALCCVNCGNRIEAGRRDKGTVTACVICILLIAAVIISTVLLVACKPKKEAETVAVSDTMPGIETFLSILPEEPTAKARVVVDTSPVDPDEKIPTRTTEITVPETRKERVTIDIPEENDVLYDVYPADTTVYKESRNDEDVSPVPAQTTAEQAFEEPMSDDERWQKFINNGEYTAYADSAHRDMQYVIYDVNCDGRQELLMTHDEGFSFYTTYLFCFEDDGVVLVDSRYGYSRYRYSPEYNALILSPEFRPFNDAGEYCFYRLNGTSLCYLFSIRNDMGIHYYVDDAGSTQIDETESYFDDAMGFDWKNI